ncbi:MAG: hypothetical protein P8J50_10345 [Acidimicrobiales bacterium]|jgi:hypothetical protein|nr:hypothetical protein [Acidimicrobiales bacterium]
MAEETAPITRDDIHQSVREVVGDAQSQAEERAKSLLPVAIGGAVVVLFIVYRLGRRVGRTKSTVVEIRRI